MGKHVDHTYEDYLLDGKSLSIALTLGFGMVALVMIVIGVVRDSTVLVLMAWGYFGVAVPLILGWHQLLPWLRRRTRERWKRPSRAVLAAIDRKAVYVAESTVWFDVASQVATEMLDEHGPLGARYAAYTLAAFRDARIVWERSDAGRYTFAREAARSMRVALIPMHPRWAAEILTGDKTVELRRRRLRDDTTHLAIYATKPIQTIVAIAHIANQQALPASLHPTALESVAEHAGGDEALAYIQDAPSPVALWLNFVRPTSLSLDEVGVAHPPQSVQYLSPEKTALLMYLNASTHPSTESAA